MPLQLEGQTRSSHDRPSQPASHKQRCEERSYVPCVEQPAISPQSWPLQPSAQKHVPLKQSPLPLHLPGQTFWLQSGPVQDGSHTHVPCTHEPRPKQSPGHRFSAQAGPLKPG